MSTKGDGITPLTLTLNLAAYGAAGVGSYTADSPMTLTEDSVNLGVYRFARTSGNSNTGGLFTGVDANNQFWHFLLVGGVTDTYFGFDHRLSPNLLNTTGARVANVTQWLGTAPLALLSQQVQAVVPDGQKVDVNTIKTQSVTAGSAVTVLASVGTAATSTAQTADNNTKLADIQTRLPAALTGDGNIKADTLRVGGTLQTANDLGAINVTPLNTLSSHDPGEAIMGATDLGTGSGLTALATATSITTLSSDIIAAINSLNQSASRRVTLAVSEPFERPESGSSTYTIQGRTYTADGAATDADSTPTLTATGIVSGSLAANLSSATNPATGVYQWVYTVASAATIEQIKFDLSATIATDVFTMTNFSQTADFVAATFTTTDRATLNAAATATALAAMSTTIGSAGAGLTALAPASTALSNVIWTNVRAAKLDEVTADRMGALTDWLNNGRLDLILDTIAADTTTDIPALIDALPTAAEIFTAVATTALTEAYAADGAPPTLAQAIFLIQQSLHEFGIVSTTRTVRKLDGVTTAATFTLNSATTPTDTTRAT